MSDQVRATALEVLRLVDERDAFVNLTLPQLLRDRNIVDRDAALATELVHGTIRMRGSYDAIIATIAKGGLARIEPAVLDALRLGTHQLLSMRVPAHAAVSTTVDLVRRHIGHKPVHFVNALLRRISRDDLATWFDRVTANLTGDEALSIRYSHPVWIVKALREALENPAELDELLAADNAAPRVSLVARPGLIRPEELPGVPGALSPYAKTLASGDPGAIKAIREGRAGVQDEGSQLVAINLAEVAIEGSDARWLDLCAGPGGKAALLGALAGERGASVVANEPQEHRAELVRQAVQALSNVEVVSFDGRQGPWEPADFDRILVDAPCTGLGALRRRPESRWRRRASDLDTLVPLQNALLIRAMELVRPGGVVVYATCSPHLAETRNVVNAALAVRPDFDLTDSRQLWPHRDGTDAMFMATLHRT